MFDRYSYIVRWSTADDAYLGTVTEFPSLSWLAESHEKALSGLRELVAQVAEDMKINGEALPEPAAQLEDA